MKPSRFSALLSLVRVADAHLVPVGDEADAGSLFDHVASARAHLAALERELMAMRDEAAAPPAAGALIVSFASKGRVALPPGVAIAAVRSV